MIGKTLINIRESFGFSSARSFYFKFLKTRTNIQCSYIYYTKIEAESAVPSPEIVETIAKAIGDTELSKNLLFSYCQDLFPSKKEYFKFESAKSVKRVASLAGAVQRTIQKQIELNYSQINAITKSEDHYLIFTVVTLARVPVDLDEVANKYEIKNATKVVKDLEENNLVHLTNNKMTSSSKELVFPKDVPDEISKKYELIDIWTTNIGKRLKLNTPYEKMMIRRISERYRDIIYSHIDLLLNLVRAADETNQNMNDHVVQFSLTLKDGKVLG